MQVSAKELAEILKATIDGNPEVIVNKLAKIEEADKSSLSFISNPKYESYANSTHAGIVIISNKFKVKNANGTTFLKVEDPYLAFTKILHYVDKQKKSFKEGLEEPSFIHSSAKIGKNCYIGAFVYIDEGVVLGENVKIYPNSYIGKDSTIGNETLIYANVCMYSNTHIGTHSIIHSGAVIGSDGFGYAPDGAGVYHKIPQIGGVSIGDNVEIGANTCIDRSTMGLTTVSSGVKIDNLVQVAHNVSIDSNTVVASQAGISGSTKIGKQVVIGGQVGFVGHITIADGVKINAQSGVSKSILEKSSSVSGSPAEPFRQHYKNLAYTRQLSEMLIRISKLEQKIADQQK